MPGLQPTVCVGHLLQRIHLGDDRAQLPRREQVGEPPNAIAVVGDQDPVEGQVRVEDRIEIQIQAAPSS